MIMNKVFLHSFASKIVAEHMLKLVSRRIGNGGKKCYEVSHIPGRNYTVSFLPEVFEKLHPGFPRPNAEALSGFIEGYIAALGYGKILELAKSEKF